jgi:hypothetical protein
MKKLNPDKLFSSFPAETPNSFPTLSDAKKKKGKKGLMKESSSEMGKKEKGLQKDPNKPKRGQYGE